MNPPNPTHFCHRCSRSIVPLLAPVSCPHFTVEIAFTRSSRTTQGLSCPHCHEAFIEEIRSDLLNEAAGVGIEENLGELLRVSILEQTLEHRKK